MRRLVLILSVVLTALPASAAGGRQDVAGLQAEYRDEQARARRLRAEAADAAARLTALDSELASLRTAVGADDRLIASQRARLRELGAREAALVARLSQTRAGQGRLLSALQMMSRRPPPPLLVPADKAVDTVRAAILIRAIAPVVQSRAQGLADRQAEVVRVRRLAALNSEQLFTTESARGDRRARIEALGARQTALQAVLKAEAASAERASRALEARLRSLGASAPTVVEAEPATARLPAGRTRLTPPLDGPPSARFGRGSAGWRWRADNSEVRAPGPARVAFAGPLSGWGQVVILDLGPGWRAVVSGIDAVSVQTGDRVADAQVLGRSGPESEIGFELRRDERPIDPAPWLKAG